VGGFLVVEFVTIERWFVISYWSRFSIVFLKIDKLFISEFLSGFMNDNLLSSNMNGLGIVVLVVALWAMSSKVLEVGFWLGYLWGYK
jgi:hypothetical protein